MRPSDHKDVSLRAEGRVLLAFPTCEKRFCHHWQKAEEHGLSPCPTGGTRWESMVLQGWVYCLRLFQMLVEPAGDAAVEVLAGVAALDEVVAVGIDELHEGDVGLHEGFGELGGIAVVHVVIGCAVADEEGTVELLGARHRVAVVAGGVFLGRAHIALGIDSVVVAVVGDGCHGHAGSEDAAALGHGHQRVEAAVAPAPDADAVLIDIG